MMCKWLGKSWLNSLTLIALSGAYALGSTAALAQVEPKVLLDPVKITEQQLRNTLIDIDFRRTAEGSGRAVFVFSLPVEDVEFERLGNQLNIYLANTHITEEHIYTLDVMDFATVIQTIETFQNEDHAKVELKLGHDFEYIEQKSDHSLVIEAKQKVIEEPGNSITNSPFSGEPISLDFQDVPVRQVLQIIAQVNGFNLVTTDTVTGNVTVNLKDVPWDQALNMILKIKGLDKRLEDNILLIAPAEELSARETQELQAKQQVAELAPLHSASIQINYAKAADLSTILKSAEGGILSARGSVTMDERTNTLLVKDTQESIQQARAMVKQLDIPIKQVLIESRMVTVRDNVDEQLGVRWGFSDQQDSDGISGSLTGAETISGGTIPTLTDRLNVNLPVQSAAGRIGIHVARLIDGTILDLELSALEQENKGEIIASPRITVANQHAAYIEQGTEIPYVQATSSGATSVEFKKAVLSLKVTPHITPDNRVILDLVVTQDTRGDTVSTSTGPAVAIDTQEISTQVLVQNGETVVLGGIFQQNNTNATTQVPLVGELPLVGRLFKTTKEFNEKRELLIFVTPKILTESL